MLEERLIYTPMPLRLFQVERERRTVDMGYASMERIAAPDVLHAMGYVALTEPEHHAADTLAWQGRTLHRLSAEGSVLSQARVLDLGERLDGVLVDEAQGLDRMEGPFRAFTLVGKDGACVTSRTLLAQDTEAIRRYVLGGVQARHEMRAYAEARTPGGVWMLYADLGAPEAVVVPLQGPPVHAIVPQCVETLARQSYAQALPS